MRKNSRGGGGFIFLFYFFSQNPKKCMILTKKIPGFARTTRETTWTTCVRPRTTCLRNITREFGLKSRKKLEGGIVKKTWGEATVTFYLFLALLLLLRRPTASTLPQKKQPPYLINNIMKTSLANRTPGVCNLLHLLEIGCFLYPPWALVSVKKTWARKG